MTTAAAPVAPLAAGCRLVGADGPTADVSVAPLGRLNCIPGKIMLVVDIWLTLMNDASETLYRDAIPLNVSPARTVWVALEWLDGFGDVAAGDGDGDGDGEVLVTPFGRLSCMPGMIRLVVDIWFTFMNEASETRWRLAIPLRVSPQRTS